MLQGKPIIGITGGIGSGKSFVAGLFGELGCAVIDSDVQVRAAYQDPEVLNTLRQWWGDSIFLPDGTVNRRVIGAKVFSDATDRARLEGLLHPKVAAMREREMLAHSRDSRVVAFVWDTPLLFETGLNSLCDVIVFVDTPREVRLDRVRQTRGWDDGELTRRENSQWALDKKRSMSQYEVSNTAHADDVRRQVRQVLSRILARIDEAAGLES
jgi:dephospho-CoA kinase